MDLRHLLGLTRLEAAEEISRTLAQPPDVMESDARTTLTWARHGLVLNVNAQDVVSAVFARPAGRVLELPGHILFRMSRTAVQATLGPPSLSKPTTTGVFGVPGWDRYDSAQDSVHIQYAADEASVELITVLFPQPLPAR